jgi:hypothetical protein
MLAGVMSEYVDIEFDCLPLRAVGRLDIPLDASPAFRARYERIKAAIDKHGSFNSYYLFDASCTFHLTNDSQRGMIRFGFEGTLLTDDDDQHSKSCDLEIALRQETCDWLTESVVQWFSQTVSEAVLAEFDRFIASGDLQQAKRRVAEIQAASDDAGGFLGLHL